MGTSASPRSKFGGLATVGSPVEEPDVCFSIGFSLGPVGLGFGISVNPEKFNNDKDSIVAFVEDTCTISSPFSPEKVIRTALESDVTIGITSLGVNARLGLDLLDVADFVGSTFIPDVSLTTCMEYVLSCEGNGCHAHGQEHYDQCQYAFNGGRDRDENFCIQNIRSRLNGKVMDVAKDGIAYTFAAVALM